MKKRISRKHLPGRASHESAMAKTGEHCPLNGWWASADNVGDQRFIGEGSIMPADKGRSVAWTLIASGPGSSTPDDAFLPSGSLQ
jgi:hypothetical protein